MGDVIHWVFPSGLAGPMKVFEGSRPSRFVCEYISDSRATFELEYDGKGGTDLTLVKSNVPEGELAETAAGWGSVLMNIKAVADRGIDLRNHDSARTWEKGFFDD